MEIYAILKTLPHDFQAILKCFRVLICTMALGPCLALAAPSQPILKLAIRSAGDPFGSPRPAPGASDVPLRTSLYFELNVSDKTQKTEFKPGWMSVELQADGDQPILLLKPGLHFVGSRRRMDPTAGANAKKPQTLIVYIDPGQELKPVTRYTVRAWFNESGEASADGGTSGGGNSAQADASWSFTTEPAAAVHPLSISLDMGITPVQWHGAFFSGTVAPQFCTQAASFEGTNEMMAQARLQHPKAWSYERDFWLTGTDARVNAVQYWPDSLPNLVRERETRRIAAMENRKDGVLLHVEDFFGHEQYGIAGNRPLSGDYHAGDEVLIVDSRNSGSGKVIAVDDDARTVLVTPVKAPKDGWMIKYLAALPTKEDPDMPGLFPPGGCYLHKFNPHGTACYYWGRLDKEWDLAHVRYGRRVSVNFADACADLSIDARNFTTAKDYVQWHETARVIAGHIIDRYGADSLTFTWSIFNEPDLGVAFWRTDWNELQRFYDYTTDAILRAFEDRGYDSKKVFIGGLELGGIFGINLRLEDFLAHCSPRPSKTKGALPLNAAFADPRLDGLRSKRVEELCRAHQGKGSPCDFISVHTYNNSEIAAAKMIHTKAVALSIDPVYYKNLWANSHESCPNWAPPPDEAAGDSYMGNGYFPSWCADVIGRQLRQAAADPRYAFGETILTTWGPIGGLGGLDSVTRYINCDDHGNGHKDRTVTLPMQVFNVLNLISDMGDRYWALSDQQVGGHVVSGFASRDEHGTVRIVLYAHDSLDTQSRSETSFTIALRCAHLGWSGPAQVQEYQFDREHNTYFSLSKALLKEDARKRLEHPVKKGDVAPPTVYSRAQVEQLQKLAECRTTDTESATVGPDGGLEMQVPVAGNGLNILVIRARNGGE